MHFAQFDTTAPGLIGGSLPWRQTQTCATAPLALALAGLTVAAVLVLLPLGLMLAHLAASPDAVRLLLDHPAATFQTSLGLSVATALVGLPFYRTAQLLGRRREVAIEAGEVRVVEHGLRGSAAWSAPLTGYLGVAHHIRTTQAGPRHEIVLVHPDRRRHIVVAAAERISKGEVERVANLLALAEVSPRLLYELPRFTPLARLRRSLARLARRARVTPVEVG